MRKMLPRILLSRGLAATDVPLGKVFLEDFFHLEIEFHIDGGQPLRHVLMHGGFASAEDLGAGTDRAACFDDVLSVSLRSFFDFAPHEKIPLFDRILYSMSKNGELELYLGEMYLTE